MSHPGAPLISDATVRHLNEHYATAPPAFEEDQHSELEGTKTPEPASGRSNLKRILENAGIAQGFGGLSRRENVTDKNIADVYASFILLCNPSVPPHTDTAELKTTFRSPPKSDGKSFNTFKLFELICKLEDKELKTWAQLAIELGVEPPALDKGQSTQKVQQYTVRLKRWMHAMHVDAFFEFLLSKHHIYWTHVPAANEPPSDHGRDGVPAEEDLALRALLPETKPKRGRRKAEDRDNDISLGRSPPQRPRLGSPALSEDFMMARGAIATPATAHPSYQQSFEAPWSAVDGRGPYASAFRWPPHPADGGAADTPISAYPQSALTPMGRAPIWSENEPQSAMTPKSRDRRRRGPAVSSAWPSASAGKLRGRPPGNRNITDGPYSTFPANPPSREVPSISLGVNAVSTPVAANSDGTQFFPPATKDTTPLTTPVQSGRPSGLHLRVPERKGATVRLATPPPPLPTSAPSESASTPPELLEEGGGGSLVQRPSQGPDARPPSHISTSMMDYLSTSITGHEPTASSSSLRAGHLDEAGSFFREDQEADQTNVATLESHFIAEILGAAWCDGAGLPIERCTLDEAARICKQVIRNMQAGAKSPGTFLIHLSALAGGPLLTRLRMTRLEYGPRRTRYECHWKMKFGSMEGDFTIRASVEQQPLPKQQEDDDEDGEGGAANYVHPDGTGPGAEEDELSWKRKYLTLQRQLREKDDKVVRLKRSMVDALVESNGFAAV